MAQTSFWNNRAVNKLSQNLRNAAVIKNLVKIKELYYSSSTVATVKPKEWHNAKPLKECPKLTAFELLRGYLRGGKFYKKDTNSFSRTLLQEKGDIVYIPGFLGRPNILMTQNPDDFETIFRNDGIWPKRTQFYVLAYYRNVIRKDYFGKLSGLMTTSDEAWYEFRNLVNPILMYPKNVKIYLPIMSKVNEDFIERIKQIRDPKTLEVPANFKEEIGNWTLESICVVALDRRLGFITRDNPDGIRFIRYIKEFLQLSMDLEVKLSLWRYLPNRKLQRAIALLDDGFRLTEKYIDEAVERIEKSTEVKPEDEKSVLEKLLKINKMIATTMAMDLMIAGGETTASSYAGILLCLAKNPAKQQKLRDEILTILPHKDSPLTAENMKNLPYLRACIKEGLRIYSILPGVKRTISKDMVLSGYQVPSGTDCFMISLNLLQDEQHFSSAKEFNPERWLRQQSTTSSHESLTQCPQARKNEHPFVYLPFGFGPRSCVGRRIAEMELEIGIVRTIRSFQVEYNYSTENAFQSLILNMPAIPLKFKFTDLVT